MDTATLKKAKSTTKAILRPPVRPWQPPHDGHVALNIGAGVSRIPGCHNIDIAPVADICLDLSKDKLPFPDDSVDLVFSYHTLEHVSEYLFALSEIYRVLRPGARLLLGLPYVTLSYFHQVNPYHLHDFNERSFDFFDPGKLLGSAAEDQLSEAPILFRSHWVRYHYLGAFRFVPPPLNTWCRRHLWNTVRAFDISLTPIKGETEGIPASAREMDALLAARVPYDSAT